MMAAAFAAEEIVEVAYVCGGGRREAAYGVVFKEELVWEELVDVLHMQV